jgi:hypothetical protein
MNGEAPYNARFELAPTGHAAVARSCGDGRWEDWVYACDREWRRLAEIVLEGRVCVGAAGRGREPMGVTCNEHTSAESG